MNSLQAYDLNFDLLEDPSGDNLRSETFEFIPPRDSRRKVRIRDLDNPPFRYICSVINKFNGEAEGTGTLIGPRTVLTAGHVIDSLADRGVKVIPARHGNDTPLFGTAASTRLILPDNYRSGSKSDYGIIILNREIGSLAGYWGLEHKRWSWDSRGTSMLRGKLPFLPGGGKVNLAGYPNDLPKERPDADPCDPRVSNTRFMYRVYDTTVRRTKQTPLGLLDYKNDTCPEMSGSPVWIKRSRWMGGRVMVAIHIAGDIINNSVYANVGVQIGDEILAFIRKHKK
jgi:V8-like Glu-specific endopeptidase